jgi:hypothetical protein
MMRAVPTTPLHEVCGEFVERSLLCHGPRVLEELDEAGPGMLLDGLRAVST